MESSVKILDKHNKHRMNTCPAVKADGELCGNRCRGDPRCATHMRTLENNGPHTTARNELKYRQRANFNRMRDEGNRLIIETADLITRERMGDDLNHRLRVLRLEQQHEFDILLREQEDEIRQTGIDPDAAPRRRRAEELRQRNERNRIRNENEQNLAVQALARVRIDIANALRQAPDVRAAPRGELANFANDNQNVHTTAAVQQTKEMIKKILNIPVPSEYRWNMRECSKTPGDIVMCCKLTPKGAWQMAAKYCQDENIYEMGAGIYGKVLDGVWQYILKSSDKSDLCKILKQEMEDNIGMCAQGNLTRLCNILSGYMEGIGVQESPAEILGRKLPMLMGIENVEERMKQAYTILVELAIPEEQWLSWVEPLVDEGTVSLLSDGSGKIIGLRVT